MSRHRSPRGRQGDLAFVIDPDARLPEQHDADDVAGQDAPGAPGLPTLPRPRVSGSGPMPVVPPAPRSFEVTDFAAALGLPPLEDPAAPAPRWDGADPLVPAPRWDGAAPAPGRDGGSPVAGGDGADPSPGWDGADPVAPTRDSWHDAAPVPGWEGADPVMPRRAAGPGHDLDPDAAFHTVTGWRPDGTLSVPTTSESHSGARPTDTPTSFDDWLSSPGSRHSAGPPRAARHDDADAAEAQRLDRSGWPDARRSIGSFGTPAVDPAQQSIPWRQADSSFLGRAAFGVSAPREPEATALSQSAVRWTSFGDFQPGEDAAALDGWRPAQPDDGAADQLAHTPLAWSGPAGAIEAPAYDAPAWSGSAGGTTEVGASDGSAPVSAGLAEAPEVGHGVSSSNTGWPLAPAAERAVSLPDPGRPTWAPDGAEPADPTAQPAEPTGSAGSSAATRFVPAATFRPASDLDMDTELEPLADDSDVVDETEATTALGSGPLPRARRRAPAGAARVRRAGRWPGRWVMVLVALAVIAVIVGVTALVGTRGSFWSTPDHDAASHPAAAPALTPAPTPAPGPGATPAPKPSEAPKRPSAAGDGTTDGVLSLANCTQRVSDSASLQQAIASARPGQKICATGNMSGSRLKVTRSGTTSAPVTVIGSGATPVGGITIEASNVIVGGFSMTNPPAPGIQLTGNNITVRNNTVKHPVGDDFDGLRFFGSNLKILNNVITDINKEDTDAHADCMQTFATNAEHPASQNVVIDGNRCERIGSQCLMAEGPNSTAGDGSGVGRSANISFTNNFCQAGAVQAVKIDDIQGVRLTGNTITGTPNKAFAILNNATGAVVASNKIGSGIHYQVGMDSSSRAGYQGPPIGGDA